MRQTKFDLIIVGMGPAGLAAASRLDNSGLSFAMIDAGKAVHDRDRNDPDDGTRGHGGAGLFSDGKFSFFPSATDLWSLPEDGDLRDAYQWLCSVLRDAGLDAPPFPSDPSTYSGKEAGVFEWLLKAYPSDYLSLSGRLELIHGLVTSSTATILSETIVKSINYDREKDMFYLDTEHSPSQRPSTLTARRLIIATGRFGPIAKPIKSLTAHHVFKRLEVGFRIQQSSDRAFFRGMKQLDPKLRIQIPDGSIEWRTFCVCRQGETCLTQTGGLWTVSGRSDCPPTGLSNCGFNTRVLNEDLGNTSCEKLLQRLSSQNVHFTLPASGLINSDPDVIQTLDDIYGSALRTKMQLGLRTLAGAFDDLASDPDAKLIGPTLEGIGWYPRVNGSLRLLDAPAWIAGDACGLFRGIVAAMISGYYSATSVIRSLQVETVSTAPTHVGSPVCPTCRSEARPETFECECVDKAKACLIQPN